MAACKGVLTWVRVKYAVSICVAACLREGHVRWEIINVCSYLRPMSLMHNEPEVVLPTQSCDEIVMNARECKDHEQWVDIIVVFV